MTNTGAPIESKWSGFRLLKGFGDKAKSAKDKLQKAIRVSTFLIDGEKPAPATVRQPENWTVRTELSRFNELTGRMETRSVLAECLGVTPADAIQNLTAQLQSGAAQLK